MGVFVLLTIAAAVIVYIIAGYPLLLAMGGRRGGRAAVGKDMRFQTTVSAILAVRDGERFIGQKLESILSLRYPRRLLEIIVVSDGSTDATDEIVQECADRGVRLICIPR